MVGECISINYPTVDFNCVIDANDYITTTQICVKITCRLWCLHLSKWTTTITETHLNYIIKLQRVCWKTTKSIRYK